MAGTFDDYQVLYAPSAPTSDIRLGQLFVDESEAAPEDMLKFCSSLSPPVYTSFSSLIPTVPVGANPTASVGLAAVNGSAATFLRSDGAPALSQSIAPTWSSLHTFTNNPAILLSATAPRINWQETDAAADSGLWRTLVNGGGWSLQVSNDAQSTNRNAIDVTRSTAAVLSVNFGNATDNPTFSFLGTGTVSLNADNQELRFGTGGDDLALYHNGTNNFIDSNTGALRFRDSGGATKIEFNTTGIGFNAATPIARPDYTITNPSTSRSIDVSAATLAQVRAVLGTLLQDQIDYGLLQ